MRGIIAAAGYLPHHRLERARIAEVMGGVAAAGLRSVASYDEDTTTLAVEAGRLALRGLPHHVRDGLSAVTLSTADPVYLDKTNATIVHAALRLGPGVAAYDLGGGLRSAAGVIRMACAGSAATLVTASDIRTGLPTSQDEADGGDAGAALVIGGDDDGPVIAQYLGGSSATAEFLDQWRAPGDRRVRRWDEKFGEHQYAPLVEQAWNGALADAGLTDDAVTTLIVAGGHGRAVKAARRLAATGTTVADDLESSVGNAGSAQAPLLLARELERAEPGQTIVVMILADGVDVLVFRTTEALDAWRPERTIDSQLMAGDASLPYAKFLTWRAMVDVEPPRRPEPARMSASAAARSGEWKYGLVASRDRGTGAMHLPPSRVSWQGGAVDDMEPVPMADAIGHVATFTIDRLVYSPSPPVVLAIVDFEGGGRLATELTDVAADAVAIGDRVEMTFRRRGAADGIVNYFWKARPATTRPATED